MSTQQIIDGWEHGHEPYSETPIATDHARRKGQAKSTNARVWSAIAAVRIERNPATMAELYDALNARNYRRNVTLTLDERDAFSLQYLKEHAPDLIKTINEPAFPR